MLIYTQPPAGSGSSDGRDAISSRRVAPASKSISISITRTPPARSSSIQHGRRCVVQSRFTVSTANSLTLPTGNSFHQTPTDSYTTPQTLLSLESIFDPDTQPPTAPQTGLTSRTLVDHSVLYTQPPPLPPPVPPGWSGLTPLREIGPSSGPASDDEDELDPLAASAIGPWDNMFSLAEAARLKQDGHLLREQKTLPFDYPPADGADTTKRRKRRKTQAGMSDDELLEMKRALPMLRGNQEHAFKDAIEMGICSLEKGRELYDMYVTRSTRK